VCVCVCVCAYGLFPLADLGCKVGGGQIETPKSPRIETHIVIWQPGVLASWGHGIAPLFPNLPVPVSVFLLVIYPCSVVELFESFQGGLMARSGAQAYNVRRSGAEPELRGPGLPRPP